MPLTTETKGGIIREHQRAAQDTGSPEVQVALLTERITKLAEHFKANKHDHHSRRGLLMIIGQRRRLLRYLSRIEPERYQALIQTLGLRR